MVKMQWRCLTCFASWWSHVLGASEEQWCDRETCIQHSEVTGGELALCVCVCG